jgi:hypothetical protein
MHYTMAAPPGKKGVQRIAASKRERVAEFERSPALARNSAGLVLIQKMNLPDANF